MNAWMTHQISNQFDELQNYNLFATDQVLQEILQRYESKDQEILTRFAQIVGSTEYYQYADLANKHTPILHNFDARGRRIDFLEFHPAWQMDGIKSTI